MAQSAFRPTIGPIPRGPQGPRPVGKRSSIPRRTYSSSSSSSIGNESSDGTRSDQNSSSTSISSHPASLIPSPIGSRLRRSTSGIRLRSYKGKQVLRGLRVRITSSPNDQNSGTARLSSQKESSTVNATDNRSEDTSPFVEHEGRSFCETGRLIGDMRGNVDMFEQMLQGRDRQIDTLEENRKRLEEWGDGKERENKELRAQILQLERQLETSECNRHQEAETSAQLRNRVEELNKQDLEGRLSSAEEEILIRDRQEAEEISRKASSECYEAKNQSHSLHEELKNVYKSIEVLERNMASLKDQSKKDNSKLNQERNDCWSIMENNDTTHEEEISRLQAEIQTLNEQNESLVKQTLFREREIVLLSIMLQIIWLSLVNQTAESSQLRIDNEALCKLLDEVTQSRNELNTAYEEAKAVIESSKKNENTANGTSQEVCLLRKGGLKRAVARIDRSAAHIKEVHIEHRG